MKLVKVLEPQAANLINDPLNQTILRELVAAPHSTSDLAAKLKLPTLPIWRRIQKLQKASLIEQVETQKVGNLEKKLYRSTAAWFAPQQLLNFKPKDPNLKEAFDIYQGIQNRMMAQLAVYNEIPKDAEPTDFSLFVNMLVFAEVCGRPEVQVKIVELKEKLAQFSKP
jgi:DNA-binding Lrp family transcriptional regulator